MRAGRWLVFFFIFPFTVLCQGQVVINEFSCSNVSTVTDNYGNYEDWLELYNTTGAVVDLTGYYLSDKATNPTKWQFPAGVTIPANGRLRIWCSGRDIVALPNIHTNFKLTQTKPESIVFANPSATILENIILQPTQTNHSRGRQTDGSATWAVFTTPTPGTANSGSVPDYVAKPVFSQNAGFYGAAVNISITCATAGATIRYTLDGTDPTTTSTVYAGPINIATTKVLRARAYSAAPGVPSSFIESNTYFINENHQVAVLSIFGDQVDDLLNGSYIEPDAALEYFDRNQVYRAEATGNANKHGNDSWAYDQRGFDFVAHDQYGYNYALNWKLFNYQNRTEFQRIIVKAAANDNYPFEDGAHIRDSYVHTLSQRGDLYLDVRTYEPCIVYLNGQYWGVYDLREKVDDADYIDYYFNSGEDDIQMLKTWGSTWSEYGGAQAQTDWDNLRNYILTNNMAVPANYNYVDSLYNVKSLVDYYVLNSYVVCSDWLNWNTEWWRGINPNASKKKWRYALWDEDATFGHYINYTGIPDVSPSADPCNPEQLGDPGGQGHTLILNALMNNPVFYQYYVCRFADLSNTVFSCPNMQFVLDSIVALYDQEMNRQVTRWGGTLPAWQQNVQDLKDFIDDRCAQQSSGMIDCYSLTGPYNINFLVDPPGAGEIKVNSIWVPSYPWTATYYGSIATILKAKANGAWIFDYWELVDPVVPSTTTDSVTTTLTTSQTIIAHFKTAVPAIIVNGLVTNPLCYGDSLGFIDLTVSGGTTATGTYNYQWSNGASSQDIFYVGPGNYTVTVTDDSAGVTIVTYTITAPTPMVMTVSPDMLICNGETVNINSFVSGGTPPYTYLWSNGANTSGIVVTPNVATIFAVTVTDSNNCPNDTGSVEVLVSPGINFQVIANKDSICPGDPIIVTTVVTGGDGGPYMIFNENNQMVAPPLILNPTQSGPITLSAKDGCGSSVTASDIVNMYPVPVPEFSTDITAGCEPLMVTFNNLTTPASNAYTYEWTFAGTFDHDYTTGRNPVHLFTQDGIYDITLTVTTSHGCKEAVTKPAMVTIYPDPTAGFDANPGVASIIKPVITFTNLSQGATTYQWLFGDGDTSDFSGDPFHRYAQPGDYLVSLICISDMGCTDTVFQNVVIREEQTIYAPTGFSPDGDYNNDLFRIYGTGIGEKNYHLYVYNRWGEVIFESSDIYDSWDGKYKGNLVELGTYTWFVLFEDYNGKPQEVSGRVTVIR